MEILEYGAKNNKKIILIHGFESPYQIWDDYINYYKENYHIIVPILEGHNSSKKEEFISFDKSVSEIEEYYISRYGNEVYAIYGMSLGGILASKIWENQRIKIEKLIMESSPLVSYGWFMRKILTYNYLWLTHKVQKRDKKTIKKAINTIIPKDKLKYFLQVIDNISDTTIINYVKEIGFYKLSQNIITKNTKIYYYYGTKINELYAKKTSNYIKKNYSSSVIKCFIGKGHCEDSIMHPDIMINELNQVFNDK